MINTLNEINYAAKNNPQAFIKECNEEYIKTITEIAQRIEKDDDLIIIAIAGPSWSGKTTTAHILKEKLEALNETTAVVSLDDFYLPGASLPLLPDGNHDIESVNALDISLIKECFSKIIKTGKASLPKYDFKNQSRIPNATSIDIGSHGTVIVEGLHAMNPLITDLVPRKNILKI